MSSCKVPVILVRLESKFEIVDRFLKIRETCWKGGRRWRKQVLYFWWREGGRPGLVIAMAVPNRNYDIRKQTNKSLIFEFLFNFLNNIRIVERKNGFFFFISNFNFFLSCQIFPPIWPPILPPLGLCSWGGWTTCPPLSTPLALIFVQCNLK